MKKTLLATIFFSSLSFNCAFAAGIPTFDGAQVGNSLQQLTQQLKDYEAIVSQLNTMKETLSNTKAQLDALTNYKGFGDISIDVKSFEILTGQKILELFDSIEAKGFEALSQAGKQVYKELSFDTICANKVSKACETLGAIEAETVATFNSISDESVKLAKKLIEKSKRVAATKDTKAIQELVASNQSELQLLQMQTQSLELLQKQSEYRAKKAALKEQARMKKILNEAYK